MAANRREIRHEVPLRPAAALLRLHHRPCRCCRKEAERFAGRQPSGRQRTGQHWILQKAETIWIAGGDQSNDVNFRAGIRVQQTLNDKIAFRVSVGGTSAGLNVLTQFIYSAQASPGETSSQAFADRFNRYMSFDRDFVDAPALAGIIDDPQFDARDRAGRDLAFMCRIAASGWSAGPRGVSVDEQTALLLDDTSGRVVGNGNVPFPRTPGPAQVCAARKPLTCRNISVYRINSSGTFNVSQWKGQGGVPYSVTAEAGVLTSTQSGGSLY